MGKNGGRADRRGKEGGVTIKQLSERDLRRFYEGIEWRRARYQALKSSDGRCELCGAGREDGVVLNVDHIKPLRSYWHLRLTQENLQVLCHKCNHGKGNWDETDWRSPDRPKSITQTDEHLAKFGTGMEALEAGKRVRAKRKRMRGRMRVLPTLPDWGKPSGQ